MPGFTPFSSNYTDLSDANGYQFEFRCDICGSGYRSEFIRSKVGTAGNILGGASSILGGLFGSASTAADRVKDITDRGARDEALKKASNDLGHYFKRCPRNNMWVDETCWNDERGLCVNCAPKLASEMEAERAQVQLNQMRTQMESTTQFTGDLATRTTICTNCGKPVGSEKFCSNCGTPVGLAKCKSCGNDIAPGQRFCGNCGTPA